MDKIEAYRFFEKQQDKLQMRLEQAKKRKGVTASEISNLQRKIEYYDMMLQEIQWWLYE